MELPHAVLVHLLTGPKMKSIELMDTGQTLEMTPTGNMVTSLMYKHLQQSIGIMLELSPLLRIKETVALAGPSQPQVQWKAPKRSNMVVT